MPDPNLAASPPLLIEHGLPRYCLRCSSLLSLVEMCCHRCRLTFDPHNPATYSTQPRFVRWKFWFPGFALAVASGVLSYAVVFLTGEMGFALFVAVPVSFSAILGYATNARLWGVLFLSLIAVAGVVSLIVSMNLAGLFCGLTLAGIFLFPALVGCALGWSLSLILKNSSWDQRHFLPVLLFAALPYGVCGIECLIPHPTEIVTVETGVTFHATPEEAWNSIMFYEQVEHEPPFLLKLALPRPIRAEGRMAAVGDVQRCIYPKGELVKQITRRVQHETLEFCVIEQHLHFEHDVTLVDGSFRLEPIEENSTQAVLSTRYIRHLRPAWIWQPMERKIVHTLHGHVLEGMRRRGDAAKEQEPDPCYPPVHEAPFLVQSVPAPE